MQRVDVERAAELLRAGGLVAFPTETVYGLGADATDPAAVARIFEAKGRPRSHPLIVHLASSAQLSDWARVVPPAAQRLADMLWPGPLTLVLERAPHVIDAVTGGLSTVALRVPAHPVALELLARVGRGVAAPSANRFGSVSPTRAEHVEESLGDRIDALVDGGPCSVGVESTIVDVSTGVPRILRAGGVPRELVEQILGAPVPLAADGTVAAPGTLAAHYAPRARVLAAQRDGLGEAIARARAIGGSIAVVCTEDPAAPGVTWIPAPADDAARARSLYQTLRELDAHGHDVAVIELPDARGLGLAIADRIRRAAAASG